MTQPDNLQGLREVIRQILIDPARLEFGEDKVNLRVGGTVDRIMNEIEAHLDTVVAEARVEGFLLPRNLIAPRFQKMYTETLEAFQQKGKTLERRQS